MVVNLKGLLTRMKEAYKNQGYTVAVDDGIYWIDGRYWLVWLQNDEVTNEILSLITLHTRKTLQNGEAYKVVKGDDGPIVQKILLDAALEPAKTMGQHLEERTNHDEVKMLKTNLRYDGCTVWQNNVFLSVMTIDPRYEALIENKKGVISLGTGIYAEGNIRRMGTAKGYQGSRGPAEASGRNAVGADIKRAVPQPTKARHRTIQISSRMDGCADIIARPSIFSKYENGGYYDSF